MKIPIEIIEKYGVSTNHLDDEYGTYDTFLKATDFYIVKAFETLMSEPAKFLTNIISIAKENAEVMKYRTIARTELAKLKQGGIENE